MYLDYAEMQAQRGVVMYMKGWVGKLDAFLQFNEKEILQDSGKIITKLRELWQKASMKSIRLFKTVCLNQILTGKLKNCLNQKRNSPR